MKRLLLLVALVAGAQGGRFTEHRRNQAPPLGLVISNNKPLGSAASWAGREKVLVTGASGALGATLFGYLQRCTPNNIFSGLGDPRGGVGTPRGAKALNKRLGSAFVLAHASVKTIILGWLGKKIERVAVGTFSS